MPGLGKALAIALSLSHSRSPILGLELTNYVQAGQKLLPRYERQHKQRLI